MQGGNKRGRLQRPFVVIGAVAGALLSVWYLYREAVSGLAVPHPIWLRFVNVALIMFCSIYFANFVRRMVEKVRR